MSIRARLLWLTLLVATLPALLTAARFLQDRDRAIEANGDRLAMTAQRTADNIAERVQGTGQLLFGLARARDLSTNDRAACSSFLSQVREAHPQYTSILTINPDGTLFCDSLRSGRDINLVDRGYFKVASVARDDLTMEPTFGRLTGQAVLQIARPVRSVEGKLQFVLLASLNLQKLVEEADFSVPGAHLLLLDNTGTVLATSRKDPSREQLGSSAGFKGLLAMAVERNTPTEEIAGANGEIDVWSHADPFTTGSAGLHVLVGVPKRSLLAPAHRRFVQDFSLLAAAALAIFLAVWFVTETAIRKQISRILRMAAQLSAGDLSTRIEPPLPKGELGVLMEVLNRTAQSLEQQRYDITALNERLRQSQRQEAVGQLTGGVAHDFNNLLTVVMGNAELLTELSSTNPEQWMLAEMIRTSALRGAELTQRLLAFARKQALQPRPVDLGRVVAGMGPMLHRTLGADIEMLTFLTPDLWPALVDEGQVENALLNLCLNARDAMPDGGRLTVEIRNVQLDAEYADRNLEVVPGSYLMLVVSDSGHGIEPAHLRRVFEPFFTTKDKDRGTGLGLAMVYGFVKQSGGHAAIYSELGYGTSVKLYLPRATDEAFAATAPLVAPVISGGNETILLVEDDEAVRLYAHGLLQSFGYRVFEASNGPMALSMLAQRDDVDLLLTDVVMPGGLNGPALAAAARKLRPGLRVLYTSGYTENAIMSHGSPDFDAKLLTKPYKRSEMDRAVRAVLDSTIPEAEAV